MSGVEVRAVTIVAGWGERIIPRLARYLRTVWAIRAYCRTCVRVVSVVDVVWIVIATTVVVIIGNVVDVERLVLC